METLGEPGTPTASEIGGVRLAYAVRPESVPALAAQLGMTGAVSERAPQKYLIQNHTGLRLFYWADRVSARNRATPSVFPLGAALQRDCTLRSIGFDTVPWWPRQSSPDPCRAASATQHQCRHCWEIHSSIARPGLLEAVPRVV